MFQRSVRVMIGPLLVLAGATASLAVATTPALADPLMTAATLAPPPGGFGLSLAGLACPGSGSCAGVGSDTVVGTETQQAVIATQADGTWGVALAPLPADGDENSPLGSDLDSIACQGIGHCIAVGFYTDTGGQTDPLVETETAGTWSAASVPASTQPSPGSSFTFGPVACPALGGCVAAFNQVVASGPSPALGGSQQPSPFVAEQSGSSWQFDPVTPPSNATLNPEVALASLSGIACPAAGSCVGVGYYTSTVVTGTAFDIFPMVVTESNGTWQGTSVSPLPAGDTQQVTLNNVACPPTGPCTALGDANTADSAFTITGSGTTWQDPVALPVPAQGFAGSAVGSAISCPSSGSCVLVGTYLDQRDPSGAAEDFQPHFRALVEVESDGTWVPSAAAVPADAGTVPNSSLGPIACTAAGDCTAAGQYTQGVGGSPGAADVLTITLPQLPVTRISGQDAVGTSIAVSQAEFPTAGSASTVVLARSDFFSDALAGGPLAAKEGGPLLTTPGASASATLDPRVLAEIQRVLPTGDTVYVLGGDLALSPEIDGQLAFLGYQVVREAGSNEYATAVDIAQALGDPSTIFEATGLNFADALSAVPAAISVHGAILLTNGSTQAPETAAYLAAHTADTRYAIGGPLVAAGADPSAAAVFGQDLYDTSAAVAARFFPGATAFGAATGTNFPDALSGGVFMGAPGTVGPMLLVEPSGALPVAIADYLADTAASIGAGYLFGGTLAVGDDVLLELAEAG